jgi:hypothetical protein
MKNLVAVRLRDTTLALLLTAVAASAQSTPPTSSVPTSADEMSGMHMKAAVKVRSTTLTVTLGDKTLSLTPADLAALPHETITAINGHTKTSETYTGVPVAALLVKLGLPFEKPNEHTLLKTYVVAEGSDGYKVLVSTYETLSTIRGTSAIVADTLNGQPLTNDGAFKLVIPGDTRPQRWVQNLKSLTFKTIE